MKLTGLVALVTGGAKRVGRAIVLELADAGCAVAVHYHRSRAEAEALVEDLRDRDCRAATVHGDLHDPAGWADIITGSVEKLGRLDILINNAAVFLPDRTDGEDTFDLAGWESTLRTNAVAPAALCHYAAPHLRAGGRGRIVNLCDITTDRPCPDYLAYSLSKAALTTLTKGLARALAPEILVNGVAPGIAVFPEDWPIERRERLTAKVPLRRAGSPQEVADLVRFLLESGDYITGQIIPIDGGRSIA
jgi:pteridine reductase